MRNLTLLLSFLFCASCSMFLDSEEAVGTGLQSKSADKVRKETLNAYQAPFYLDSVFVSGTELWIEVSFSGGCVKHDFMLVWPEFITMVYPPDFGITLYHNSNEDNCKALISHTLKIDLRETPLGEFDANTIAQMRINVVNGQQPELSRSSRTSENLRSTQSAYRQSVYRSNYSAR